MRKCNYEECATIKRAGVIYLGKFYCSATCAANGRYEDMLRRLLVVDNALDAVRKDLENIVKIGRYSAQMKMRGATICAGCQAEVLEGQKFCSSECRENLQIHQKDNTWLTNRFMIANFYKKGQKK